uniref:Uncharacterized protein n=1 Tax=Nelumbo nucifera TaxID=4432 RepID=A0A822XWM8_NELNU|nr:TPA_asm: hypothetical protein HUJ06_026191 [Nelumbo nucifera]
MVTKAAATVAAPMLSLTKHDYREKFGNLNIPYLFGVGNDPNCFRNGDFQFICNTTSDPPVLMTHHGWLVMSISLQGEVKIVFPILATCYVEKNENPRAVE